MDIKNENNTIKEEIKNESKKVSVFALSSFAQTIFQSLMSMKVAQTKLTWDNFKTSCLYSAGIIISETFLEPKKFQWISNIKSWIYSKINPQQQTDVTKFQLATSLGSWFITSSILSYIAVILDKLSNSNFETFFDFDMLKTTGTDLSLSIAISFLDSGIIEILKENINKFKTNNSLEPSNLNDSQDIESDHLAISVNIEYTKKLLDIKAKKGNYKSLLLTLPLFLSSTALIWLNESLNNDANINSKILDDLPLLLLYNLGSVTFSSLNCIVNGDELPLISLFKNCVKSKNLENSTNFSKIVKSSNGDRLEKGKNSDTARFRSYSAPV